MKYLKFCCICLWLNVVMPQKTTRRKSFNAFPTSQKTDCRWQITSAFPWCCLRWPWAACPATPRAGGCKRTCIRCRWARACTQRNCFCLVFGKKFNIMSTIFVHQSPTLSQKIDSREGLFWCKKGAVVHAGKMNFYLRWTPPPPVFGPFPAKWSAFWCKTRCNMPLNAVCFGAKCSAFWC